MFVATELVTTEISELESVEEDDKNKRTRDTDMGKGLRGVSTMVMMTKNNWRGGYQKERGWKSRGGGAAIVLAKTELTMIKMTMEGEEMDDLSLLLYLFL